MIEHAATVAPFLPAAAVPHVEALLGRHAVEVRISRPRRTKLGDHRPPAHGRRAHRISINGDLNPYAFLTTLLHEIAHAAAWETHRGLRRRRRPHGPEWQRAFAGILHPVVSAGVLPDDVARALARALQNPRAATCSDRTLLLTLARYDAAVSGRTRVEELPDGSLFRTETGAVFRAAQRLRTRRQCFDERTGAEYRVHGLALVEPVTRLKR
jgi:SprT protein